MFLLIRFLVVLLSCCGFAVVGVADGDHWAFKPLMSSEAHQKQSEEEHPIDAFIGQRLRKEGLTLSPPAEARTLLRRAYLDLTGVPPTFREAEDFVADDSPDAFERVIDQLLSSPAYGERWGRHWLDVARYSDAKGYVDSGEVRFPFAYTYRDYVVGAFNSDLPFDQFIREQIAADRIDGATPEQLAALGFLTVGSRFNFFPHEIIDDRIDVVTRGFLGLTVQCARCHDHKFDPISARDYYSIYSMFANSYEPTPDQAPVYAQAEEDAAFLKKLRETAEKNTAKRHELHQRTMHELRAWSGDYLRYIVQSSPDHRTEAQPKLRTERGLIREVSAYSAGGVVRWQRFLDSRLADDPVWGMWRRVADMKHEDIAVGLPGALDEWANNCSPNPLLLDSFRGAKVSSLADVTDIYGEHLEAVVAKWETLLKSNPEALRLPDPHQEQIRRTLYAADSPGTILFDELDDVLTLDESTEARKHFADVERVFLEFEKEASARPMLLRDKEETLSQRVFVRGDAQRLGETAPRTVPEIIAGGAAVAIETGSGRLELAESIAHPDNPLTARVIVNRVWAWHFGHGLVTTPSDFGVRSEAPSHPELLDFLAQWFIAHDWSLKQLHRLMLTSRTWQQTAADRADGRQVDPGNRLFWRANRQRLDFETMRDAMLAVSGTLEDFPGGRSVRRPPDDPENRYRSIYSHVDRENLPEVCSVFDFPSPDISAPQRSRTTVPQQALFLLNSPFTINIAEAIAKDSVGSDADAAITRIYRQVLARNPDENERQLAKAFLESSSTGYFELAQALLLSNEFQFAD